MLADYVDTTRLYINSREPFITLNMSPNIQNSKACYSLKFNIESLCVPKTYYNIFTVMSITFTDISSVEHSIDFGMGEWNLNELMFFLADSMTNFDGIATYTVTINPISNRIEIVSDTIGTYILETDNSYLAKYFGMNVNEEYVSEIDTIGFSNIPDPERTKNFILQSSLRSLNRTSFDNVVTFENSTSNLDSANCLIGIFPCIFQSSDLSDFFCHRGYYGNYSSIIATGFVFPNSFNLTLVDDFLTPLDLNGNVWTTTIFVYLN